MASYRLAMSPAILYFVTTKSLAMVNSSLSDSESDIFRVFDLNSLKISFFRYYFSFDGSEIIDCVNVAVLKPVHFFLRFHFYSSIRILLDRFWSRILFIFSQFFLSFFQTLFRQIVQQFYIWLEFIWVHAHTDNGRYFFEIKRTNIFGSEWHTYLSSFGMNREWCLNLNLVEITKFAILNSSIDYTV